MTTLPGVGSEQQQGGWPGQPHAADADTADLAARVRLAVGRLSRRLARGDGHGFSQGQLSAVVTVEAHGPLTLGELASREGVAPPTVTRLVQGLTEAGLLTRQSDPADRRASLVTVSRQGRELLARLRGERTAQLACRLAALSPEERALLAAALPVLERLSEWEPEATGPGPCPAPGC